jgi:oxygen-dependent protoporphyrinogen oxidase
LLRVAIVGGGLSGLTTAYELVRRTRIDLLPIEIRLYEAEGRVGGTIRTERRDGYLIEHGADSFPTANTAALKLATELGLRDELIPAHAERGVLVWWEDALHPLPPGLSPLADVSRRALLRNSLLSKGGKARAAFERLVPRRKRRTDESIAAFVTRRFGRQMLERVGDPLLAGSYYGDPAELGMAYNFPELVELERGYGSVSKGLRDAAPSHEGGDSFPGVPKKVTRSPVVSFRAGMETLIDAVTDAIRRNDTGALQIGRPVTRIVPAGDPVGAAAYGLETVDGETWVADICVLALPARVASRLVESFAPEVAEGLASIVHTSSLAVYLGYSGRGKNTPDAIGCLVPHVQERPAASCSLVHQEFAFRAPPGAALLRVHMGGARKPPLVDWEDASAVRVARKEVAELLGVKGEPALVHVLRRPRAHPQYMVDHGKKIHAVERELGLHSGLLLAGSCLYGATVPDVIANGRATAGTVSDLARTRLA